MLEGFAPFNAFEPVCDCGMDCYLGVFGEDGLVKNFTFERGFVVSGIGFAGERGKSLKNTVAFEHELDDPLIAFAPDRHVVFLSTN